jgi:hypothetical protein
VWQGGAARQRCGLCSLGQIWRCHHGPDLGLPWALYSHDYKVASVWLVRGMEPVRLRGAWPRRGCVCCCSLARGRGWGTPEGLRCLPTNEGVCKKADSNLGLVGVKLEAVIALVGIKCWLLVGGASVCCFPVTFWWTVDRWKGWEKFLCCCRVKTTTAGVVTFLKASPKTFHLALS